MFRKTVMTSAIIGVGLVSSAGAAFAGDAPSSEGHHHGEHSTSHDSITSCSNAAKGGSIDNGGAKQFGAINGSEGAIQGSILCDAIKNNGNGNGSGNKLVLGDGAGFTLPGLPSLPSFPSLP